MTEEQHLAAMDALADSLVEQGVDLDTVQLRGAWLNLGSGPHRAPAPWLNLDVVENDEIKPDRLVPVDHPFRDFPSDLADRVYLGHVLEHIPWARVPQILLEVKATLRDGGEVLVVGPDVFKTIERYKLSDEPWSIVEAVLEDAVHFQPVNDEWEGARHQWNSREGRIVGALEAAGFQTVRAVDLDELNPEFEGWPVVSFARWQCAVKATK